MKKRFLPRLCRAFVLTFACLCAAPHASAGELSAGEIQKFIATFADLSALTESIEADRKAGLMDPSSLKPSSEGGKFSPFTAGLHALAKQDRENYIKLVKIVKKNGFDSPLQWAEAGDRIMPAYMALKIPGKMPDQSEMMAEITPEMRKMMPPETLAKIEEGIKQAAYAAKTIEDVPQADKEAVRPFMGDLDRAIGRYGYAE